MNKFSFYFESSSANMPDTMDFPLLGVVVSSLGETFLFDPPDLRFSVVVNVCNITALSFVCLLSLCIHLSLKLSLSHLRLLCRSLSLSFKAVFFFSAVTSPKVDRRTPSAAVLLLRIFLHHRSPLAQKLHLGQNSFVFLLVLF